LIDQLPAKGRDFIGAIHFLQIDNIEFRTFREEFSSASIVYVIEEHIPYGGLFSRILHVIQKTGEPIWKLRHRSLAHNYPHNYGSQRDHLKSCGLDYESLLSEIGEEVV
jgi:transketolase C-terminal domain/subunit